MEQLRDRAEKAESELRARKDDPLLCAAAKPGEITYECDATKPCAPCRARGELEKAESELAMERRNSESNERYLHERLNEARERLRVAEDVIAAAKRMLAPPTEEDRDMRARGCGDGRWFGLERALCAYDRALKESARDCGTHGCRYATNRGGQRTNGACRCDRTPESAGEGEG